MTDIVPIWKEVERVLKRKIRRQDRLLSDASKLIWDYISAMKDAGEPPNFTLAHAWLDSYGEMSK